MERRLREVGKVPGRNSTNCSKRGGRVPRGKVYVSARLLAGGGFVLRAG